MAVGAQAVAGADGRDLLVVVVVDVVGAAGEPAEAGSLPPREDGATVVGLRAEVRGRLALRDRLEPDDVAARVEDLGTVGVGARSPVGVMKMSPRSANGLEVRIVTGGGETGSAASAGLLVAAPIETSAPIVAVAPRSVGAIVAWPSRKRLPK